MPRACTACSSPQRKQIEAELLAGTSLREIAGRFSLSISALDRHRNQGHITARLQKSAAGREITEADSLAAKITAWERRTLTLYEDALQLLQKAKDDGESRTAIAAVNAVRGVIGEAREMHRLMAELAGKLPTQGVTIQNVGPMIVACMQGVDPQVRATIASRLQQLEAGNGAANR